MLSGLASSLPALPVVRWAGPAVLSRVMMGMSISSSSDKGPESEQPTPSDASQQPGTSSTQAESTDQQQQTERLEDVSISQAASTLRSFDDIFSTQGGGETAETSGGAGVQEEINALEALAPQSARQREQGQASSSAREITPGERLLSKEYGYAALGGELPKAKPTALSLQSHPRLHPSRTFLPGQTYEAEDLNAYAEPSPLEVQKRSKLAGRKRRPMPSQADVASIADFKNVAFLERFMSPAGKILGSKQTRLPPSMQVKVAKQIKLARNMALIAGESLYDKRHLRYLREAEERQKQL